MKYQLIFTNGYEDDSEALYRELRADVLVQEDTGAYYNPLFITLNRINVEFESDRLYYLEDTVVIMHKVTKETIVNSIQELHKWQFYKRWIPLFSTQLEKYFFPTTNWSFFEIIAE